MVMLYSAAFDVTLPGLGTMTLSTSGESDAVVNLATMGSLAVDGVSTSNIYNHYNGFAAYRAVGQDPAASSNLLNYARANFSEIVEYYGEAALLAATWTSPAGFEVSFQYATSPPTYTISWPTANFTIAWSTAAGRALFGFAADSSTPATTHTGTLCPTYVYVPTLQAVSDNTPNFEASEIANHVASDGGSGFGLQRTVVPVYRDWKQEFETKALTMRANAASPLPWTMQHLFEHCRGQFAFIVASGFGESFDEYFSFRTESTRWNPQRHTPGNDAQFFHDFRCTVEGTVTTY